MGWLTDFTNWLREQFQAFWNAIEQFGKDMGVYLVERVLELVTVIANAIPVPDALQEISICGILSQAGPTALWVIDVMQIPEGMTVIAAMFVFRMLRKLLTLFQW